MLCMLVVDARDCGRFLLLIEVAVVDRERDSAGCPSVGNGSARNL